MRNPKSLLIRTPDLFVATGYSGDELGFELVDCKFVALGGCVKIRELRQNKVPFEGSGWVDG